MASDTVNIRVWIKNLWFLKAINIPLLLMGFEPRIPQFFIGTEVE
jgi:hypothetical protein